MGSVRFGSALVPVRRAIRLPLWLFCLDQATERWAMRSKSRGAYERSACADPLFPSIAR
jgi:hypothetical protein